jgi:D-alanine-D-alanine ligase
MVPRDILIDKSGRWHIDGVEFPLSDLHSKIDVAVVGLHGAYGEDGKVQSILTSHGIPFTGSDTVGSAVSMNKALTKSLFLTHGVKTPIAKEIQSKSIRSHGSDIVAHLFRSFLLPAVVKPTRAGSSVGVSIVRNYADLEQALLSAAEHGDSVLIEEFIPGVEATCGVIEHWRGHELYALPPVEIRPAGQFFDYESKYSGGSREIVPSTFSPAVKAELEAKAKQIHQILNLKHYSRSDFIVHPKRGIYALEVNTLPGLTDESLFPKSLRAVGSDVKEFVKHIVDLAMRR